MNIVQQPYFKLQRLEVPKFHSEPKQYHKWKATFDRFTKECDDNAKYDYLLACTVGDTQHYVENRSNFTDAMIKLDEKYGNVHTMIGLLIDEIKSLPVVRKGDYKSFENLNFRVNDFHERLIMMGRREDAENSYILKEIESKLNSDDLQKWLESLGDNVDTRKGGELVKWLDKQTYLRWITFNSSVKNMPHSNYSLDEKYRRHNISSNAVGNTEKCLSCNYDHRLEVLKCNINERWERVKSLRICFICLKSGHSRFECTESPCDVCWGPHNRSLHNYSTGRDKSVLSGTIGLRTRIDRNTESIVSTSMPGSKKFEVHLPWKINPETLLNNKEQAISRDVKLVKKMKREPEVYKLLEEQIKELVETGFLLKVEESYPKRYLPLLVVTNMDRESTKVRICLDAKCKYNGVSFNDALLKGKMEMTDIFQVLTGFRCGKFTKQGDIKKMFWQIKLNKSDEQYHGVIFDEETYVFTRVCFGNKPSPNIANECMMRIAAEGKDEFPHGAKVIIDKRYVDDILEACSRKSEIMLKRDETSKMLGKFGFEIKSWKSNHPNIGTVDINSKVLDLHWNGKKDVLSVVFRKINKSPKFSKRTVLSTIAEVWDPLGMCAGVLSTGKLIFQSIVRMGKEWDKEICDIELAQKWNRWVTEIRKCEDILISRSLLLDTHFKSDPNCELIGFSDGSSVAHGCALYLRWLNSDESTVDVKFVGAKGKLNPMKGITVPCVEICGAFILSRLVYSAKVAFCKTELSSYSKQKTLFTDSTTVLSWIKSASIKYKPFVKNKKHGNSRVTPS